MAIQPTENWMSQHLSSTYNIGLYVCNKDVWNNPMIIENFDAPGFSGATCIARTGKTTGYSIDNVILTGVMGNVVSNGGATSTNVSFDIQEAFGNWLPERISSLGSVYGFPSVRSCFLVMRIAFMGYDPATNKPKHCPDVFYYSLSITGVTGTYDESGTRYSFTAITNQRLGVQNAHAKRDTTVQYVNTLGGFLAAYTTYLNISETETHLASGFTNEPLTTWAIDLQDPILAHYLDKPLAFQQDNYSDASHQGMVDVNTLTHNVKAGTPVNTDLLKFIENNLPAYQERVHQDATNPTALAHRLVIDIDTQVIIADDNETHNVKYLRTIKPRIVESQGAIKANKLTQEAAQKNVGNWHALDKPKMYHYLFTGKNTEVLSVELNLDNAFFVTAPPVAYQAQTDEAFYTLPDASLTKNSINIVPRPGKPPMPTVPRPSIKYLEDVDVVHNQALYDNIDALYSMKADGLDTASQEKAAGATPQQHLDTTVSNEYWEYVHNHSTLDLEIVGDPYWVGTPNAKALRDKETLTGLFNKRAEAHIVFLNYRVDETVATGRPNNPVVDLWTSGVYLVREVTSKFQGGSFTQQLKTTKSPNYSAQIIKDYATKLTRR